jgi:hypothetical protein
MQIKLILEAFAVSATPSERNDGVDRGKRKIPSKAISARICGR